MHVANSAQDGCLIYLRIADPPPRQQILLAVGGGARLFEHIAISHNIQ